ncbi:MAG: indolepyruvate oxidoreductase subunit beta [Firmicutes bacterium]|nr:indolepyruvate oxidoreductase subunit beta [Bacillota bacterium]MBQ4091822.1 indolepyruvate oxidoreductase subunit beta [Bacillota bacterium]MBQ6811362.1 indolepyruvate oxidoreductase subunit beta [Bacillota bacterium]
MKSCLLCGVGGQGTVLASRIIASAAMEKGLFARTAETIGMAQRGGSVVSHVRIGEKVPSPMIPQGKADLILGFEPGEALRNLGYLKEGGTVILCAEEVQPVTAALASVEYNGKTIIEYLKTKVDRLIVLDTERIINECGSPKVINVALMGAMAATGIMDITLDDISAALKQKLKPQFFAMNEKALQLGAEAILGE